jgi:hypothetical protein
VVPVISRRRHPKKEIADALREARQAGLLVIQIHRSHRWGQARCQVCGAHVSVWSTPRDPGGHAKEIDRFVRNHKHDVADKLRDGVR